jgi:hypothetical protein
MSQAKTTTDHKEIRHWIESRKGQLSVVKDTEGSDGEGLLRVDFRRPDKLEDIDWETFFETFGDRKLAFLHQDRTVGGKESRFFKVVGREA